MVDALQNHHTYAGRSFTVTLTPPICVGIRPSVNSGAVLQKTPPAGVLLGARFRPLISSHVFCAMAGEPKAVFTEVMTGFPAGGCVTVPEPVKVNVLISLFSVMVAARDPLAPRKAPVPPVIVQGKFAESANGASRKENDAVKLSLAR